MGGKGSVRARVDKETNDTEVLVVIARVVAEKGESSAPTHEVMWSAE